jgi:hypothetical protein
MRADSRQRLLISPRHTREAPTLRRKDNTCGARLQLVCTEIGAGASRNRDERFETEGNFLWQPDVKLTESEIIGLRVAEAGARSASRRRVRDDRRVEVHDLLNARVLQRAIDGLFGALAGWRAWRESPRSTVARSSVAARGRRSAERIPAQAVNWPRTG